MYAIIDKTTQFVASGKKHNFYVEKAVFGELGWRVKLTKDKAKAKRYKTYAGAYKFCKNIGAQYEIVNF